MEEIRATLSRRSSPATERVTIHISWQRRMLRREPKSVVKTKVRMRPAKRKQFLSPTPRPANGIIIDGLGIMSLDGHKHQTNGIAKWDLTHKSDQSCWWQPLLWSSSWRWQPPALEASSASAPAAKKPAHENADDSTKPSPNNDIPSMKQPEEGHKRSLSYFMEHQNRMWLGSVVAEKNCYQLDNPSPCFAWTRRWNKAWIG